MADTDPTTSGSGESAGLFGARWFMLAGGYLVVAFAMVTALSAYDASHRRELEKMEEKTGVGDPIYFPISMAYATKAVLSFDGHGLYVNRPKSFSTPDSSMIKAGRDESQKWIIYRSTDAKLGNGEGVFYVKTGQEEYMQLVVKGT